MNELTPFDNQLAGLLASLTPAGRRQLAMKIARALRASQQQRIRQQQAPDGTPFTPRKSSPARHKRGRVKRQMFQKLRTAKYLKATGTPAHAVISFTGRVQRMAKVHQYGLRDRPSAKSREVQYAARPLLGFSQEEGKLVEALVIEQLSQ